MMARRLGKEGKVVLRLFINEKGRLLNVEVVERAGYGFTEAAVEAVKMSTFSPAHEKGVSTASKALLTIRFVLKKV
jgi:protein TonB